MIFSRDNIIFEYDALAHAHTVSQDTVKDVLVDLTNEFISELGIIRLDKIIVKETNFTETELGRANYESYTIILANQVAYRLADKNNRFYQSSLAVLKHELYHFLDRQNLALNFARGHILGTQTDAFEYFRYWTEFFASYSTFDICEDPDLYESFKSAFKKINATDKEKKYYTCRLLGYFLHDNHSEICDELVKEYLSHDAIEEATNSFKSVLQSYPVFSTEQLRNIGYAINKVIIKQELPLVYKRISNEDLRKHILLKSKGTK